jgi:hypothetical protein
MISKVLNCYPNHEPPMSLPRSKTLIEVNPSATSAFARTIPDAPTLSEIQKVLTCANDSDRAYLVESI